MRLTHSVVVFGLACTPALGQGVSDVRTGVLDVRQIDSANEDTSVDVTVLNGATLFGLQDQNRGDFEVGFGTGDDLRAGVMIPAIRNGTRSNADDGNSGGNPGGDLFATVTASRPSSNTALFVSSHGSPSGSEMNVDVGVAFFPFDAGFVGGHLFNSANNASMTGLVSSPGISLGRELIDSTSSNGVYQLDLRGFGATGDNGVLIVAGGKNEDNFGLSKNLGDGRYELYCKDNGSDGATLENDPVAFVYLPYTTEGLVAGRVAERDGAQPELLSGVGGFGLSSLGPGAVLVQIDGVGTPEAGVLLVSAEGGDPRNTDNIVVAQWTDALQGFIVETRDIPGMGRQGLDGEPMFSFAYIPVTPGPDDTRRPQTSTIVVLPDTQLYAQNFPSIFDAQLRWVADNASERNIPMVLHLGDITNRNNTQQWSVARAAFAQIDGVVPYTLAQGNHDVGPNGNASNRDTLMDTYFPYSLLSRQRTFGGVFEGERVENLYSLFEAANRRWIAISLEWGPRDVVLDWANDVLSQHADRLAIVITHAYMYNDDTRMDQTVRAYGGSPYTYGTASLPGGTNDGGDIWRAVTSQNDNVVMVMSGHIKGEGRLASPTGLGNTVHEMLSDYQGRAEGGEGYLRLLEVVPDSNVVRVRTYSPWTGLSFTSPGSHFEIELTGPASRSSLIDGVDIAAPYGEVDFFDLLTFLRRFDEGDTIADTAAPYGLLNDTDVRRYLAMFADR